MIGLIETVERCEIDNFKGRQYRLGSRIRLYSGQLVTVLDCGEETDFPVFDYVTQSGDTFFAYDSEIAEVILL